MIGNRPRRQEGPSGERKEDIGQVAGHEIHLEIEDVLDKKERKKKGEGVKEGERGKEREI